MLTKLCMALNGNTRIGLDPTDYFFLAMAYHGRGDKAEADRNFPRGVELARKAAAHNTELRMLWSRPISNFLLEPQ